MRTYPITLTVNRERTTLEVPANRTLLELLKADLHLASVKLGCGIGECGACTVIMNGQPVNACLVLAVEADGAVIETAEGAAEGGALCELQQAFIDFGAIQCGFCTPGVLNSARALLLRNPKPTRAEIVEALAGNFCRCTGYEPIIQAVEAVARGGYRSPEPAAPPYVGGPVNRVDGVAKVMGTAVFVHDMALPGMLHARILTSPHPAARIVRIDTEKARSMPGVKAVLTGADLPYKLGLYMEDKDILARGVVRHQGEAVAAVAAETVEQARAACEAITVEYQPLAPVLDVHAALRDGAPQVHPELASYSWMKGVFFPQPGKNIAHCQKIRKGDVAKGLRRGGPRLRVQLLDAAGPARAAGDPHGDRHGTAGRRGRDRHLGAVPVHGAPPLLPRLRPAAAQGAGAGAVRGRRLRRQGRDPPRAAGLLPVEGRGWPARQDRGDARGGVQHASVAAGARQHDQDRSDPRRAHHRARDHLPVGRGGVRGLRGEHRPRRGLLRRRAVRRAELQARLVRGLHQQALRHRLPRLRASRAALGRRAQHGPHRPRDGARPVRVPPQEPAPRRRDDDHGRALHRGARAARRVPASGGRSHRLGPERAGRGARSRRAPARCAARASRCCRRRRRCRRSPPARR